MCKYFRPKNKTLIRGGFYKRQRVVKRKIQYQYTKIGILTGVIADPVSLTKKRKCGGLRGYDLEEGRVWVVVTVILGYSGVMVQRRQCEDNRSIYRQMASRK